MFGLFGGDKARVRKIRVHFDDIRQRVLYKMNGYEQYCFASALERLILELEENFESIDISDFGSWNTLGDVLLTQSRVAWNTASKMGGVSGEGAMAGANALALMALQAQARSYANAEALVIQGDLRAFQAKVIDFLENRVDSYDMIPKD